MTWSASGATCGGSVSDKHMRLVVADTGPINYSEQNRYHHHRLRQPQPGP
jgi:hypothetical protein